MKYPSHLQLRYLIAIIAVITLLMTGSGFYEMQKSRTELYQVMEREALSLVEVIHRSSTNILLSSEQMEGLLSERLLNNAYFIARLDSMGLLTEGDLEEIASANNIYRITYALVQKRAS
jgi:hypothetical protein